MGNFKNWPFYRVKWWEGMILWFLPKHYTIDVIKNTSICIQYKTWRGKMYIQKRLVVRPSHKPKLNKASTIYDRPLVNIKNILLRENGYKKRTGER